MRAFKLGIAAGVATVALALPASAPAEAIVPPGNSAANQYTETAPSAGGEQLPPGGNSPKGHSPSPTKALGAPTADRLEELGPAGRATAALAAAGAPARSERQGKTGAVAEQTGLVPVPAASTGDPDGSSGLGQVLGQATGISEASNSSLPLLLALAATVLWAATYLRRRRGRAA
jgi:hypothetical protein